MDKQRIKAVRRVFHLVSGSMLLLAAGCANRPDLGPPGPVYQQQMRASIHDPYSDVEAGPEIVGGRPRDFQKPFSEAERSRWLQNTWWGR